MCPLMLPPNHLHSRHLLFLTLLPWRRLIVTCLTALSVPHHLLHVYCPLALPHVLRSWPTCSTMCTLYTLCTIFNTCMLLLQTPLHC